jgi:hypothetical protein
MKIRENVELVKYTKRGDDVNYDIIEVFDNLLYESDDKIDIGAHIEEYAGNRVYLSELRSYFKELEEGEVVIKVITSDTLYPESINATIYLRKRIYLTN